MLKAVEKGNFKVTAQDVATLAGVDLRSAQKVRALQYHACTDIPISCVLVEAAACDYTES